MKEANRMTVRCAGLAVRYAGILAICMPVIRACAAEDQADAQAAAPYEAVYAKMKERMPGSAVPPYPPARKNFDGLVADDETLEMEIWEALKAMRSSPGESFR
jgi:hypothetical protein